MPVTLAQMAAIGRGWRRGSGEPGSARSPNRRGDQEGNEISAGLLFILLLVDLILPLGIAAAAAWFAPLLSPAGQW
jgi:hypothetical protein